MQCVIVVLSALLNLVVTGCIGLKCERKTYRSHETERLKVQNLQVSSDAQSLIGTWTLDNRSRDRIRRIELEINEEPQNRRRILTVHLPRDDFKIDPEDPQWTYEIVREAGTIQLSYNPIDSSKGRFTFQSNEDYAHKIKELFQIDISLWKQLELFVHDVEVETLRAYHKALDGSVTLEECIRLNIYHVDPKEIAAFVSTGYILSPEDYIRLNNYHLKAEYASTFKQAGYDFSVDELIRLKNYHLTARLFSDFKAAGYDFSIDEIIQAKNYHLDPQDALVFREAGYDFSLRQLIRAKNFHLDPHKAKAFGDAGLSCDIEGLIRLDQYHIKPDYVVPLYKAGYRFTIKELIRLKQYHVSVDFILDLTDPEYALFSAEEFVDFKNNRIDAQTIQKIRKRKTHETADSKQ